MTDRSQRPMDGLQYRVLLLGRPALVRDSAPVALKSDKGKALLWYLAAHSNQTFSRAFLSELLWDDSPPSVARHNFSTMLYRLRPQLPVDLLSVRGDALGWNATANAPIDLDEYKALASGVLTRDQRIRGPKPTLTSDEKRALRAAISLWHGDFLEGVPAIGEQYEAWLQSERQEHETQLLRFIALLIRADSTDGEWEGVLETARRGIRIDPLQEPLHRAIMRAHDKQGNRAAAISQYQRCHELLAAELNCEPDAKTIALFKAIKGKDHVSVPTGARTGAHNADASYRHGRTPSPLARSPEPLSVNVPGSEPPLIGREDQYRRLWAQIDTSLKGERRIALLHGEAGVGKTRLLRQCLHDAVVGGRVATALMGSSREATQTLPFSPWIESLDTVLGGNQIGQLQVPELWLRELARLFPNILLSRPELEPPAPMRDAGDQQRLLTAITGVIAALPQPILLILDDMQWADDASLTLLSYVMRRLPYASQLALVTAVRAGDESESTLRHLRGLQRDQRLAWFDLGRLPRAASDTLVNTVSPDADPVLVAQIYEQAQGNPLYTVELTRMLRDRHAAQTPDASVALPLPPTVKAVLTDRITRLGPAAVSLAGAAATFTTSASLSDLCRVTELPEREAVENIAALVRAGIFRENDDNTFTFDHDMIRLAAESQLSSVQKAHYHRRALDALLAKTPQSQELQHVAVLARHATAGGLWESAIQWCGHGADTAEALFAFPTACAYLQQLLYAQQQLPDTLARRQQALDVKIRIAKLDYWSPPDSRDQFINELKQIAVTLDAQDRLPSISLVQAESYIMQGRCKEALVVLETLRDAVSDPMLHLLITGRIAGVNVIVGDYADAIARFDTMRAALTHIPQKSGTSTEAAYALSYASLGDFARADAALAALAQEEHEQGYDGLTTKSFAVSANVAYLRGHWSQAIAAARAGIESAHASSDPHNEYLATIWLGASLIELDETDEAIAVLKRALTLSHAAQTHIRRDFIHALLATAHLSTAQRAAAPPAEGQIDASMAVTIHLDAAQAAVDEGMRIALEFGYKEGYAFCTEVLGRVAAAQGACTPDPALARAAQASAHRRLTEALRQFEALNHVPSVARCHDLLAAHCNSHEGSADHRHQADKLRKQMQFTVHTTP